MKQETTYPKLNDLLGGLGNLVPGSADHLPQDDCPEQETSSATEATDDDWELFKRNLASYNFREKKMTGWSASSTATLPTPSTSAT